MLGSNGGPIWSGPCCYIHVASMQSVLEPCGDVAMCKQYSYKVFCKLVVLWIRLLYHLHIHPAPSVCMILARSGLLSGGCRLCWAPAIVVQEGQAHVAISVFHRYRVFRNLVVIWIGLQYPPYTHSISECCGPNLSTRMWAISGSGMGEVVLTSNCGPRWSRTCSYILVSSI